MLVDDHDIVRRGLSVYLDVTPDLVLAGEANTGEEAMEICARVHPDVVLMDLVMPGMGGVTATQLIHERWPEVKVIALTSFREKELVQEALRAGAMSYLVKNVSCDELTQAIRAAYLGQSTFSPEATQALIQTACQASAPGHDLTASEQDVLALMVKGLTNAEIAEHLHVSYSTARARVSNILAKLGVSRRSEAVALALRYKLVT
ncbi:MAG: response regulator transcription factor [Anaerolineae bacterium]|nr:response regulator transcription factor [Anaerolineae bacterium]